MAELGEMAGSWKISSYEIGGTSVLGTSVNFEAGDNGLVGVDEEGIEHRISDFEQDEGNNLVTVKLRREEPPLRGVAYLAMIEDQVYDGAALYQAQGDIKHVQIEEFMYVRPINDPEPSVGDEDTAEQNPTVGQEQPPIRQSVYDSRFAT